MNDTDIDIDKVRAYFNSTIANVRVCYDGTYMSMEEMIAKYPSDDYYDFLGGLVVGVLFAESDVLPMSRVMEGSELLVRVIENRYGIEIDRGRVFRQIGVLLDCRPNVEFIRDSVH